uniref:Tetratricopeptide repeat protein n=1 Tax=Prevotella sp. GTC17253 TaxID=3236793 RepID=A0AB33IMT6_9BACT
MKKIFLLSLIALSSLTMSAQGTIDSAKVKAADKLLEQYVRLFADQKFKQSGEVMQERLNMLKAAGDMRSKNYALSLVQLGKCQYRLEQIEKAVVSAQEAVDIYGKHVSNDDAQYAFLLDNLALYQGSAKDTKSALDNSKKALQIYETKLENNHDMAVILMHVAENSSYEGLHADAVKYELRALGVLKQLYGEHSQQYLEEVPYLEKYYKMNDEMDKASKLAERIKTLTEETNAGKADLPPMMEFKTAEECTQHKNDMLRYCNYYLNHALSAEQMGDAGQYIFRWIATTDLINVYIGSNEAKLFNTVTGMQFMPSYMAGCAVYAIKNNTKEFSLDLYKYAIIAALNHYSANKKILKKPVKEMDKYLNLYEKNPDKFYQELEKNYAELQKERKETKSTPITN